MSRNRQYEEPRRDRRGPLPPQLRQTRHDSYQPRHTERPPYSQEGRENRPERRPEAPPGWRQDQTPVPPWGAASYNGPADPYDDQGRARPYRDYRQSHPVAETRQERWGDWDSEPNEPSDDHGVSWWTLVRAYVPLVLLPILVALHDVWAVEFILVAALLVFPGVLLLRAVRVPGRAVATSPLYIPAASLAVLLVSGLAVDLIGPVLGIQQPLRTVPLLCGLELVSLILVTVAITAPPDTQVPWPELGQSLRLSWPLLVPLVAAAGALRMNNGSSNAVAAAALGACLVLVLWMVVRADRLSRTLLSVGIYAVGLALMLGYSLRGTLVYGYDISTEYGILHETVVSGVWHLSHPGDAYGALPTVTVLPTELHFLTGITALMTLKLVYPAITALYPVGIFHLCQRFLRTRWAFAAAAFVTLQAAFGQELVALARQEIALAFFIALLCAMYDTTLNRLPRFVLAAVFGVGMAISHYSTVYFAVGMLVSLVVLQWLVSMFRRDTPRLEGAFAVALVASVVSAALWYGPITKSGNNLTQFVSTISSQGLSVFSGKTSGPHLPAATAADYQSAVATLYRTQKQFVAPFPDAGDAKYDLQNVTTPSTSSRIPAATSTLNVAGAALAELAEAIAACAALYLAVRRKSSVALRQVALLAVGALLELLVMRVSATFAAFYNQPRAIIQGFAVLGIPLMWAMQELSGRLRRYRLGVSVVAAVAVCAFFLQNSGLGGVLLGTGAATNLSSQGEDYDRFYTTPQEAASAEWLAGWRQSDQLVYADEYGELRLNAENMQMTGLLNDITPETLDRNAWVYATTTNIVDGTTRVDFDNDEIEYRFPLTFLDSHYDLVYTDGASEVYHAESQ